MDPDPTTEELIQAIDHELEVVLNLSEDFKRLVELARETGRRHHELYMSWLSVMAADAERTPPSGGFVPRFVKK